MVGQVVGQSVQARRGQALAEEFAAARRGRKTAVRKRRIGQWQPGEALVEQFVERHRVAERGPAQGFIVVGKTGFCETHARRQRAKDVGVGAGLTDGRDGRAVQQHVGVAVGQVNVPVLQLRGGRQDVVGVIGGVGAEVFHHHGEQVLARKSAHHFRRLRCHGNRVAVVDHQRLDLRAERRRRRAQQVVADRHHVDRARPARAQQVGPVQGRAVQREVPGAAQQQAAGAVPPGAGQRRQAGDEPGRVAAAVHPLHAVVQADRGGPGRAVVAGQLDDLSHGNAAHLRRALGRPGQRARAQLLPAERVVREVVVVEPVVADQLVHQRKCQRTVGAGQQGDVLVAFVCGFGAARVDADHARAIPLGLLYQAPEVQVARDRIAAPDHDQLRFGKKFHLHAHLAAQRLYQRLGPGGGADGAVQQRGAQAVEKPRGHALALNQPHGAGIAVGHDRFGVSRGDRVQLRGDVVQRLVPTHRLEPPRTFGSHAPERLEQALGVVGALGVTRDLGAQHAVGRWMVGVSLHPDCPPVQDRGQQGTGVGAVVRAGAAHGGGRGGSFEGLVHGVSLVAVGAGRLSRSRDLLLDPA